MDKPFKTIDEQIAILNSRNVLTDYKTGRVLKREGYYSVVNGYKDLFLDKQKTNSSGNDVYIEGTKFSEIYDLFCFDRNLRMSLFRYFFVAEATLKTVCAYQFSREYKSESEAYLNKCNYTNDKKLQPNIERLIEDFKIALNRHPYKKPRYKSYMKHYIDNHDEVPLWVVTNYLTLGQIFKFYCFQKESLRNKIAKNFSDLYSETHDRPVKIHDRDLRLIYDHIKDFRNICAHDERLFCAKVSPSRDTPIASVIKDLKKVLTKEETIHMEHDIVNLLLSLSNKVHITVFEKVLKEMGINSLDEVFAIAE